jgi:hypothetical protein
MLARLLLAAGDDAEQDAATAADAAANARFVHRALAQALDDEREPRVVLRAIDAHATLLVAGVELASPTLAPTDEDEDEDSRGAGSSASPVLSGATLESLESLFGAVQRVLARWGEFARTGDAVASASGHSVVAACLALLSGSFSAAVPIAANASVGTDADGARRAAALHAGVTLSVLQRLPVGGEPCTPATVTTGDAQLPEVAAPNPPPAASSSSTAACCAAAVSAAVSLAATQPLFAALSSSVSSPARLLQTQSCARPLPVTTSFLLAV